MIATEVGNAVGHARDASFLLWRQVPQGRRVSFRSASGGFGRLCGPPRAVRVAGADSGRGRLISGESDRAELVQFQFANGSRRHFVVFVLPFIPSDRKTER